MLKRIKRWLYLRRANFCVSIDLETQHYIVVSYDNKGTSYIEMKGRLEPGGIVPLPFDIPLNRVKTVFT